MEPLTALQSASPTTAANALAAVAAIAAALAIASRGLLARRCEAATSRLVRATLEADPLVAALRRRGEVRIQYAGRDGEMPGIAIVNGIPQPLSARTMSALEALAPPRGRHIEETLPMSRPRGGAPWAP